MAGIAHEFQPHDPRSALRSRAVGDAQPESLLASEFAAVWRAERMSAEEFLARQAATAPLDSQGAVRVIFEELCLREDAGEQVDVGEYLERFPQWQNELKVLFECDDLVAGRQPRFPEAGERFGEFQLDAELGRGALGRVFLATQPGLADRQVVLKLTPCHGGEHLALARVQHTHIVPLYFAREDAARNLRVFCMPYLGGATLTSLLAGLASIPASQRNVAQLRDALLRERAPAGASPRLAATWIAGSYTETVCRMVAALADALQFVHERGLVHLDVKPSNVLVTADGLPMLLDFHLTREPLCAQEERPGWFGGTPEYMAPEQRRAWEAISNRQPIPQGVDGRADVYGLGLLLYEALGGRREPAGGPAKSLHSQNAEVSLGLSDIVARCLAPAPEGRYPTAAAVAVDLRRHLANLPLVGVANRSLAERFCKWQRRSPAAVPVAALASLTLIAAVSAAVVGWRHLDSERRAVEASLATSERLMQARRWQEAGDELQRGLERAHGALGVRDLETRLRATLSAVQQACLLESLHHLVNEARFSYGHQSLSAAARDHLVGACEMVWDRRSVLLGSAGGDGERAEAIRQELFDVGMVWADLVSREPRGRDKALAILDQTAAQLGSSTILGFQRAVLSGDPLPETASLQDRLETPWEFSAYGRVLLGRGDLPQARAALDRAVDLAPDDYWAHFYQAACAYQQRDGEAALAALRVCVALEPRRAQSFYNRGLVYALLGKQAAALRDFDRALQLDPSFTAATAARAKLQAADTP